MFKRIPVWIALCCMLTLAACGTTQTTSEVASLRGNCTSNDQSDYQPKW